MPTSQTAFQLFRNLNPALKSQIKNKARKNKYSRYDERDTTFWFVEQSYPLVGLKLNLMFTNKSAQIVMTINTVQKRQRYSIFLALPRFCLKREIFEKLNKSAIRMGR